MQAFTSRLLLLAFAFCVASVPGSAQPAQVAIATSTSVATSGTAAPSISYNASTACIAGVKYTNNVLPAGAGEFQTNGLDRSFWGGVKTRTVGQFAGSWGPGFYPSWGRHQYDTYFADTSDGLGLNPFTIARDRAVAGAPQGLRIDAAPLPASIAKSLAVMANDQWQVAMPTAPFRIPSEGSSLTIPVNAPNGAQNGWTVGMGYSNAPITWIGTLTSGGATPSGNGTGGSSPWTISHIHLYAGTPGTTVTPTVNDEGGLRAYTFPQYYAGALDANINLQYGYFTARLRMPDFLPALSPAFWTLETGGVAKPKAGLLRDELDIEEMFGNTAGNSLNAGQILWNSGGQFFPKPTGVYRFASGTPQSTYHDYGALLTPDGTTFYLDGRPLAGHVGGPDWTQGSGDKEIMLMFQIGAPGSWLDAKKQGMSNPWPQSMWAEWLRVYRPTSARC